MTDKNTNFDIEIEDPFKFLDEQEREEYMKERRKESSGQRRRSDADESFRESERNESLRRPKREYPEDDYERDEREERLRRRHEDRILLDRDDSAGRRARREYEERDEACEEEDYDDDDAGMRLAVRVASIITGVIILVFVGLLLKDRVFDRYLAPDPDEVREVAAALPEGYTEKDDTVVVSGASSLNLRSVPSTSSDEYIVAKADEGTELKRVAVSDDGEWAMVEYEGQRLYGSMKYLKEK